MRKIVFRHSRAPGDILMFTAGVRDFRLLFPEIAVNVESRTMELWDNNPHIDRSFTKNDPGVEFYPVGYPAIQGCNDGFIHFSMAFLLNMISIADAHERLPLSLGEFCAAFSGGRTGDKDQWSDSANEETEEVFKAWREKYRKIDKSAFRAYGDLHLSEREKEENEIRDLYGVENYWVIAPGGKRDCTTKIWDWRKFQKVIDHFHGAIKFVTIGRSDHLLEPLRGTISYVDKTPNCIRPLVPLVYHADGCVSGVSFLMHLAGAMPPKDGKGRKPCVSIYGGREPCSFTWYTNHQILHTNGAMHCCDSGGCWQSRVTPIAKDADKNNRMCHDTVERDGRTVQKCMDMISSDDVIRAIEVYYNGGRLKYIKPVKKPDKIPEIKTCDIKIAEGKQINILASLQSSGGGEQSSLKIADVLQAAGWKVNFYAWDKIHQNYEPKCKGVKSFKSGGMAEDFRCGVNVGLPLLFYANDQIWDFCSSAQDIVNASSALIVGINYANGDLPRCKWIIQSGRLKAVVFQNKEKQAEFERDSLGMENVKLITLYGAIDLDRFYQVPSPRRDKDEPLRVIKHCKPDWRKYVTEQSENSGEKIHLWQKHFFKERDTKFYKRLIDDVKFPIVFEFMEAHKELREHFAGDGHFVFHSWDSMPVADFLSRGHIYLYRTSNKWRDQYPRCVAEAIAVGMPILTEPRDGTADRVIHGDTGMHCCDYDQFLTAIKTFHRKEGYRFAMGQGNKEWARKNLDPRKWIDTIENVL